MLVGGGQHLIGHHIENQHQAIEQQNRNSSSAPTRERTRSGLASASTSGRAVDTWPTAAGHCRRLSTFATPKAMSSSLACVLYGPAAASRFRSDLLLVSSLQSVAVVHLHTPTPRRRGRRATTIRINKIIILNSMGCRWRCQQDDDDDDLPPPTFSECIFLALMKSAS